MTNAAANLPPQRRARTRREATASGRVGRTLPPPVLADSEADEDARGWIEAHFERLVAFAGSAAIAAAIVSRLLPTAAVHAKPVVLPPMAVPVAAYVQPAAPSAVVATPPADQDVVMPVAPPASADAPTDIAAPAPVTDPAAVAAAAERVDLPAATRKIHVAKVLPTSRRHAKARSHRTVAHAAEARTAADPSAEAPAPSRARNAYNRGDLETAQQLLRNAGHVGQADRVASVARYLAEAKGELREHDEAPATRAFEAAASADRSLGFGSGKIARDVSHQVGLLHVAAGLRARRAGNEAGARKEFEAAHRADPSNSRASVELQPAQPQPQSQQSQEDADIQDAVDTE